VEIRFSIKDTGIGISKEGISKLFQPFSQVDVSTTRKYGGTGLGLIIAKRLANQMRGDVFVNSQLGVGSEFGFTAKFKMDMNRIYQIPQIALEGLKALILDDNETNIKILEKYLQFWGCKSDSFTSSYEAFSSLKRAASEGNPYDFVLSDYMMPEMDGFGFARLVRNDEITKNTVMILLSSMTQLSLKKDFELAGFQAYLYKPLKLDQLKRTLLQVLFSERLPEIEKKIAEEQLEKLPKLRILLAEDNIINQKVASTVLRKMGHEVVIANNGLEAFNYFRDEKFSAILMDMQMPEMGGIEATQKIRAYNEQFTAGNDID